MDVKYLYPFLFRRASPVLQSLVSTLYLLLVNGEKSLFFAAGSHSLAWCLADPALLFYTYQLLHFIYIHAGPSLHTWLSIETSAKKLLVLDTRRGSKRGYSLAPIAQMHCCVHTLHTLFFFSLRYLKYCVKKKSPPAIAASPI